MQRVIQKRTPWGTPDHKSIVAEGIVFYATPSHGGYHLSPYRQRIVKHLLPEFKTFAGGPWYEEDCDAALIPLVFPDCFSEETVKRAAAAVKDMAKRDWREWQYVVQTLNLL